jgi:hypothetical protein
LQGLLDHPALQSLPSTEPTLVASLDAIHYSVLRATDVERQRFGGLRRTEAMSEKSFTVLVIATGALFCACCSSFNVSSSRMVDSDEKVCSTFAVMPFYYPSYFPYTLDRLRESLLNALRARGLDRDYWETNWERVDTLNISFVNLNEEQADTIARLLEVDLLITGEIRNNVTFRHSWYATRAVANTMLLKAYHTRSRRFVLREAPKDIVYWGLIPSVKDFDDQAKDFVDKLVNMGYLK